MQRLHMTGREGARLAGRAASVGGGRDEGCRAPTGIPVGRYVPVKRHRGEPGNEGTHGTYKHKDEPHKHPSQPSRATIRTAVVEISRSRPPTHKRTYTHNRATSDEPGADRASGAHRTPRGRLRKDHPQRTRPCRLDPPGAKLPMRGDGGRTQAEASGGRPRLRRGRPLALRTQLYSVYRPPRWQTVPVQYRYLLVTRYATSIGALRTLV